MADENWLILVACDKALRAGPYYVRRISLRWVKEAGHLAAAAELESWPRVHRKPGTQTVLVPPIRVAMFFGGSFPGLATPSALNMLLLQGRLIELSTEIVSLGKEIPPGFHAYGVETVESLIGQEFRDTLEEDYGSGPE